MFCNFCGKEVDEGTQTCPHCGANLKADTPATADPVKEEQVAEAASAATEPVKVTPPPAPAPKPAPAPAPKPQAPAQQELQPNGMALAGFILAFFFPYVGIILSIVGLVRCKKGYNRKGLAIAGIILSALSIFMNIISYVFIFPMIFAAIGELGGLIGSMAL